MAAKDTFNLEAGPHHKDFTGQQETESNQVYWKCSPLGIIVRRFKPKHAASPKNEEVSGASLVKGGWKTTPFIIGNEISEKLAMIGLHVNLITYLTQQLNMSNVQASVTLTNFNGLNNITPLIGAYVADAHLGRYVTIIIGSITYAIGILLLTIDATEPALRPPPCAADTSCVSANSAQKGFLYLSFTFFALGSGGIKPCVAAFGADQFDQHDPKQKKQSYSFFNWYFFGLGIAILLSVTVIVYIQDHIGWGWGFGIPAIAMFVSVIFFLIGSPLYRHVRANGSPFVRILQVISAAFRKRKMAVPADPAVLNYGDSEEFSRLRHTEQFRFLDKAALSTDEDYNPEDGKPLLWRLCTVQQVEELKCIIRTSPIWATGIIFTLAHSLQNTFTIQQARSMDRQLGHFDIPPASFHVFGTLALLACVPLYDRVFMPLARKVTGHERGVTFLQRIGIGLFISILAMIVAAVVEKSRRQAASHAGLLDHPHKTVPFSAFWLVPQFVLIGLSESFIAIGHLEFFYDQFPEHLRSMASALFSSITALGSYLSTVLVLIVNSETSRNGKVSWLSDNLNRGHLDYFYWLQTVLFIINFLVFLVCAHWYRYKALVDCEVDSKSSGEAEAAIRQEP